MNYVYIILLFLGMVLPSVDVQAMTPDDLKRMKAKAGVAIHDDSDEEPEEDEEEEEEPKKPTKKPEVKPEGDKLVMALENLQEALENLANQLSGKPPKKKFKPAPKKEEPKEEEPTGGLGLQTIFQQKAHQARVSTILNDIESYLNRQITKIASGSLDTSILSIDLKAPLGALSLGTIDYKDMLRKIKPDTQRAQLVTRLRATTSPDKRWKSLIDKLDADNKSLDEEAKRAAADTVAGNKDGAVAGDSDARKKPKQPKKPQPDSKRSKEYQDAFRTAYNTAYEKVRAEEEEDEAAKARKESITRLIDDLKDLSKVVLGMASKNRIKNFDLPKNLTVDSLRDGEIETIKNGLTQQEIKKIKDLIAQPDLPTSQGKTILSKIFATI